MVAPLSLFVQANPNTTVSVVDMQYDDISCKVYKKVMIL